MSARRYLLRWDEWVPPKVWALWEDTARAQVVFRCCPTFQDGRSRRWRSRYFDTWEQAMQCANSHVRNNHKGG